MHNKNSPEQKPLLWFREWLAGEASISPANIEKLPTAQQSAVLAQEGTEKAQESPGGLETGQAKVRSDSEPIDEFGYVFDIRRTTFS